MYCESFKKWYRASDIAKRSFFKVIVSIELEMEEKEATVTNVRRTRSGKVVSTPSTKAAGKPTTRRTRKKVVLMEVEVSDDEEDTPQEEASQEDETHEKNDAEIIKDNDIEKKLEDTLLATPEDSNEVPAVEKNKGVSDTSVDDSKCDDETVEMNGSETKSQLIQSIDDDSVTFVLNDVEMFQTETEEDNDPSEKTEKDKASDDSAMQVDEKYEPPKKIKKSEEPEKEEEKVKDTEEGAKQEKSKIVGASPVKSIEEEKPAEADKKSKIQGGADENVKNGDEDDKERGKEEIKQLRDIIEIKDISDSDEDEGQKLKFAEEDVPQKEAEEKKEDSKQNGDPDAENISEDELPGVPVVKVPEAEEVSDEELPGPKRAELPADTEVVSEDELPTVKAEAKKEGVKRKLDEGDYDPGSPTSENEAPTKKPSLEATSDKEKEEKSAKPKKLPELDKYWKAVNDDPTDFTGWTYLLQYVDQENDMEAAREAYDAFLSHYPYCYGYWRKYADYEKRKGNKKKCEEVFERGLKAIPLSVDLWIHYLTYVKTTRPEDEEYVRSQFERAIAACGLEFRSDRLWDSYIKWETEGKRLQKVTAIYDRLLATPTQGYTTHFDSFQEHISSNPPNKVVEVDEFLALRKEVRHMLKHDVTTDAGADNSDAPPGDEDQSKVISSDEETKSIRERIVSIRRKIHKTTVNAVTSRWNYEEGIKRPYFHVKPLERCQLKNWQDYLDYETEQGDRVRIIVLFERCLIACALYEEFWMKFVHYLENLKDSELQSKIRDVYERACTIHHLKKPNLHLQWAMFEEGVGNPGRAAEILVNLEKSVPNVLQIAYRRINLERRRSDHEKCSQLYEHYINNSKNKMISSNIAIKYSRFCQRVLRDLGKAQEVLKTAISKDPNNPRLYLQLIDLTLQKEDVAESEVVEVIDSFLEKESTDSEQKVLFAQRKLEYLEDFGTDIQSVQQAYDQYQKYIKQNKETTKKKEAKSEPSTTSKKEKSATQSSSQSSSYGNYGAYGNSSSQPSYPYSGSQQGQYNYSQYGQGDQYQYQNWQYPQGGYGGYNQWAAMAGATATRLAPASPHGSGFNGRLRIQFGNSPSGFLSRNLRI
ncbi:hypothetical protein NQ318_005346 [Aromia moschata]|uniref:Pre-mRNA-processing factor 39 n=1 Tax=Aromia moschata TaxID=1265417 RepID=A0AAV8YXS5_9CUCU|nr:hypothetical protein NQ318_005346 [Aromia moschata]